MTLPPDPHSDERTADRIAVALLVVVAVVAAILLAAALMPPQPAATGLPHPRFDSMMHGGPGAARTGMILFVGWAYGAVGLLFFAFCFALGLRRPGGLGPLRKPLIAGVAAHQAMWLAVVAVYARYAGDPAPPIVLGFPAATSLMLYGLWPLPLVFVVLYVAWFDRYLFTGDDQRRFEELVDRFQSGTSAVESGDESP